jgi:hypothetical protein
MMYPRKSLISVKEESYYHAVGRELWILMSAISFSYIKSNPDTTLSTSAQFPGANYVAVQQCIRQ